MVLRLYEEREGYLGELAMIAVTTNSLNKNSTLPALPNAVECPFLERLTGADFLISIANYPIRTEALLLKHIEAGAILVQHKSGLDMLASMGERLDSEQARMMIAHRQYQRVLLVTGLNNLSIRPQSDKFMELTINGVDTGIRWNQYIGAREKWMERGGVIADLPNDSFIPTWCELKLKHLAEMSGKGVVKHVYQKTTMPHDVPGEFDDPLQLLIPVNDGRNLLLSLPDAGPTTVEWLWKVSGGNVWLALQIATHSEWYKSLPDKPRSFGPAFISKAQKYIGALEHADKLKALLEMIGVKSNDQA